MSIFRAGEPLAPSAGRRWGIRITAEDGRTFHWRKRGVIHTLDEDLADIFVASFKPELFQVREDGTLGPPSPGETFPIRKVEKEPAPEE